MKTCTLCQKTQPIQNFSKDSKTKDGHRSRCKTCLSKKKIVEVIAPPLIRKIPITGEIDMTELRKITEKYKSHFSLSIPMQGKCTLQVHQKPTLTFHSDSPEGVLQNALSYSQ